LFNLAWLAASAAVVLPACGGDGGADPISPAACGQPEDGTRLKAFYLVGDDGSREYFDIWYDTSLRTYCRFQVTKDGQTRCLPFDRIVGVSFLDSSCGRAMVDDYFPGCMRRAHGVPRYALQVEALAECSEDFRLFALGAGGVPASIYMKAGDGTCSAAPNGNPDSITFYPLGDEVPLSALVVADVRRQGARLQSQYGTGDDGSRGRVHRFVDRANVFDTQQGVDCDMQLAADGLVRCLPASSLNVLGTGGFSDPGCTRRIAIDNRFSCEHAMVATPRWTSQRESAALSVNGCVAPPRVHAYRLGAQSVPATTYGPGGDSSTGLCQELPNVDGLSIYARGDEVPAASFATVSLRDQICGPNRNGGTRLKVRYQTADDGLRIERGFWDDTKLGVICVFRTAADGKLRCVPENQAAFGAEFSDPDCTHMIASADLCPSEDSDAGTPKFAVRQGDPADTEVETCFFEADEKAHVRRLGPMVNLELVYTRQGGGACAGARVADLTPPSSFYEVGDEIPPADLVAGAYREP
jgi:hypothetical protein